MEDRHVINDSYYCGRLRIGAIVSVLTGASYVVAEYDQRTGDIRWQRVVNASQKEGIHHWLREHFPVTVQPGMPGPAPVKGSKAAKAAEAARAAEAKAAASVAPAKVVAPAPLAVTPAKRASTPAPKVVPPAKPSKVVAKPVAVKVAPVQPAKKQNIEAKAKLAVKTVAKTDPKAAAKAVAKTSAKPAATPASKAKVTAASGRK